MWTPTPSAYIWMISKQSNSVQFLSAAYVWFLSNVFRAGMQDDSENIQRVTPSHPPPIPLPPASLWKEENSHEKHSASKNDGVDDTRHTCCVYFKKHFVILDSYPPL